MTIYKFDQFTVLSEKRKAIKNALNELGKERTEKRNEVRKLSSEIRKIKRRLKTVTDKIGK
jgi:uncharacterized coiled-coil DUF342 family protein